MQTVNEPPSRRLNLCETTCEVRDARWMIHLDAGDEPVSIRVTHRQFGDFYDWPEAVFDARIRAALRAYDLQDNEVTFRTRGKALAAAHDFLKRYGAGEVEYLEWDIDSQSMVVVGHTERDRAGLWWGPDRTDQLAKFFTAPATPDAASPSGEAVSAGNRATDEHQ